MDNEAIIKKLDEIQTSIYQKIDDIGTKFHALDKITAVNQDNLSDNKESIGKIGARVGKTEVRVADRVTYPDMETRIHQHKEDNCSRHEDNMNIFRNDLKEIDKKISSVTPTIIKVMVLSVAVISAVLIGLTLAMALKFGVK